jgi:hypothetical protein
MEKSNCLMFEMKVLNDLRKMTSEQRKGLITSIENEELLEQEALKQNPNLHLERQLKQVLTELKDLRHELCVLKTSCNSQTQLTNNCMRDKLLGNMQVNGQDNCLQCPFSVETITNLDEQAMDILNDNECSIFSFDWLPMWIFLILIFVSFIMPVKPHFRSTIV